MMFSNEGPEAMPVPDTAKLDLIERFRERPRTPPPVVTIRR